MNVRSLLICAAVAAAGCGGSKSNLSLSAKGNAQAAASPEASAPTSLDLGNGISLERVRIVVRKLKLEGTLAAADGGTTAASSTPAVRDAGDDGNTDMEREHDRDDEPVLGPLLVDLSAATLAGGLEQVFDGVVPPGTFHEVKFVVGPVTAAKAGSDEKLAEMASQKASIIIEGTVDTKPFTFVSSLTAELEKEGDIVVSDAKSNNVTLSIDPKSWFGGTAGGRLDPSDAANKQAIEANIKASIDAFADDDKSGDDDHRERADGSGRH
jgi:hypothetical protein